MTLVPVALPQVTFAATAVDYTAIAPVLIVLAAACLGVLIEAFAPRRIRHDVQVALAALALLAAFLVLVLRTVNHQGATLGGAVVVDGPALLLQGALLLMGLVSILLCAERFGGRVADAFTPSGSSVPGSHQESVAERLGTTTEVFPLILFAIAGMMIFPAAGDLLTMFVSLEVLSMPLYVLSALARRRRLLSQEAALKYFLLGSFSSAFFLMGAALVYGYAGSVNLGTISDSIATQTGMDGLLVPGAVLLFVGLLFKVGAVPFHMWTPDVYQGAPTPVTAFMAASTKLAAFGAMLRLAYVGLAASRWDWQAVLWVIAGLTMVVGAILSVTQTDMKRLLAYSSIAHAGFIMVGLIAFDRSAVSSVILYVITYGFAVLAAFGIVMLVRSGGATGSEATHLNQWAGLGRRYPLVGACMAFLLAAFTGIPLTALFAAKYAVFAAGLGHAGAAGVVLVVIGLLATAVTAFGYWRVVWFMFFSEQTDATVSVVTPSVATVAALAFCMLVTVVLGIYPSPLIDLATSTALFAR